MQNCVLRMLAFRQISSFIADNTIPETIEKWLDEFEMFSIYEVLPEILELWGANLQTQVQSKKNLRQLQEK